MGIILKILLLYVFLFWDYELIITSNKKNKMRYLIIVYDGLIWAAFKNGNWITIDWGTIPGPEEK